MMPDRHTSDSRAPRRKAKTGNARADTLLGLTDDFVSEPGDDGRRPEIRHYPAIAMAMLPYVDLETRAQVAQMLADCPRLTRQLAFALADDAIEAAAPMLERAHVLSDGDLIRIVRANPAAHAMAVARRSGLHETVIDALLTRGHPDVDRLIERHHREALTADQAERLARRTAGMNETGTGAARVHAGPPRMAAALPDRTLANLFWAGDRDAREAVMTVISRKPAAPIAGLPQRFGSLARAVCEALVQLAEAGRAEDLIAGFARVADIARTDAARILTDDTGEPLAVTLAALQFDAKSARTLIAAVVARPAQVAARLNGDFASLGAGAAGRLLQALCARPCDEAALRIPAARQVYQGQRPGTPASRRSGLTGRRRSDRPAATRAS